MAGSYSYLKSLFTATSVPALVLAAGTAIAKPSDDSVPADANHGETESSNYLNNTVVTESLEEQVMKVLRSRPVNLNQLEALFQTGADPNFRIRGDVSLGLYPLVLDNEQAFEIMVMHGLEPDPLFIDYAIRDNLPWAITPFLFDDDIIYHLDLSGDNWVETLERAEEDGADLSGVRQALSITGVIPAITARIAKETAEMEMIQQGGITADIAAAAIQRAESRGLPASQIPFLNAEALRAAIDENNLELAELILERGVNPNDPGFVTRLAAIHVVHSAEAVELLSNYSADWLQPVIRDVLDKESPAVLAVDRDEPEVIDAILARVPNALENDNNLIRRIEGFATLDVIQQYGVLPISELNEIDGRIVDSQLREMVDGLGYDAETLITVTGAKIVDVPSVSFEELATDFSIVPHFQSSQPALENVTLLIVEAQGGESDADADFSHQLDTTRVARGVTAQLGFEDADEVVIPLRHKFSSSMLQGTDMPDRMMDDPLRKLLRSDAVQDGRIIFSYSMGAPARSTPARDYQAFFNGEAEEFAQRELGYWDQFNPILFSSVGNGYGAGNFNQDGSLQLHSGRAMDIGSAVWHEDGYWSIPEYSDIGAGGLLAPMTLKDGEVYEGTSFGAPYAGATYRGLAATHGFENGLGYDALTFAMLASTDRRVQAGPPFQREDWVEYTTNAAGMPFHPRALSGVVNAERADALANEIRQVQEEHGLTDVPIRSRVDIEIDPTNIGTRIGEEYVYRIAVPSDMTLSRLSLFLPQTEGAKSPITLESPSGYTITLPVADNGMVSTRAFLAEDVDLGAEFIIRTNTPLIENEDHSNPPFIVFRGLEPGNTIAHMRDVMMQNGRMLEPLSTINASNITDPPVLVVEANASRTPGISRPISGVAASRSKVDCRPSL